MQAARYSDFTDEALEYYTGLLGATLVDRLHMRIERSYYGDLLKQELEKSSATERDDLGDGQGYGGYGNQGGYGIPQQGRGGGGYGYGGGGGGGGDADEAPPDDRVAQILPGVTMLGVGARTELLQRARDEGVDALVVFGVSVERNVRARLIYNTTKMRLFNVATEDQLVASRNLNNIALQKQLEKDPEDDTINLEFDRIFEVADASFRCVDFPSQIEAKHVAARVNRLQGQKEANPLWMLGEIRFYQSRDLLSAENMAEAFAKIVPDKAADLVKGLDDDGVKSLLAPWLGTVAAAAAGTEDESDLRGADEGEQPRKKPEFR